MADLTWVDVIDSAVKISAGALISGIGAYFLTRSKQDHENKKIKFEQELIILKEIVERIEESGDYLNDYSHLSRRISLPSGAEQVKINSQLVMSGYKSMIKAQGLAYLIGQEQLSTALDEVCKFLLQFYYFVSEKLADSGVDEMAAMFEEAREKLEFLNKSINVARNEVTVTYSKISIK
ncbi:hypothetical protein DS893_00355 [Vibrionales bacterium C3R12]|nr:hypothetical protein DS893_00355 [Vibrionales bacterium C3R12]